MKTITKKIIGLLALVFTISFSINAQDTTIVFEYTGDYQTFVVPENISSIDLEVYGASSANHLWFFGSQQGGAPGKGGMVQVSWVTT